VGATSDSFMRSARFVSNLLREATNHAREPRLARSWHATMIRFRKQFSLRMLMLVTALLGINFAWVPWPTCLVFAVAIVVGGFIAQISLIECLVYAAAVFVLVAVSMPPHGYTSRARRRMRKVVVAPWPTVVPAPARSAN
jgi:hypothetical protein